MREEIGFSSFTVRINMDVLKHACHVLWPEIGVPTIKLLDTPDKYKEDHLLGSHLYRKKPPIDVITLYPKNHLAKSNYNATALQRMMTQTLSHELAHREALMFQKRNYSRIHNLCGVLAEKKYGTKWSALLLWLTIMILQTLGLILARDISFVLFLMLTLPYTVSFVSGCFIFKPGQTEELLTDLRGAYITYKCSELKKVVDVGKR